MSLSDDVAGLELVVNDALYISPCLQLVLYTDGPLGEVELDFYQRAMDALRSNITHYDGVSSHPVRMNKRGHSLVPTWIKNPRLGKSYNVNFCGSNREQEVSSSNISLDLFSRLDFNNMSPQDQKERKENLSQMYEIEGRTTFPPVNMLQVTLPIDHELAEPTAFYQWVVEFEALKSRHFCSGHAGIAVLADTCQSYDKIRTAIDGRLGALLLRHPGLDWEYSGSVRHNILGWDPAIKNFYPRIKRVNWLTILGDRALNQVGGVETLVNSLQDQSESVIQTIGGSLLIKAGDGPRIGDISKRDFLPAYRQVALQLKNLRIEQYSGLGNAFSDELATQWLSGLDREYA